MQAPPILADSVEFGDGRLDRQVIAADAVRQATGPEPECLPARLALERRPIRVGHHQVESGDLRVQVGRRDPLLEEPVPEASRPHLVDDVDDLGLFHEVIDELGGVLAAVGGQPELVTGGTELLLDLDDRRDGLVGPVAGAYALTDGVGPFKVRDHCASLAATARVRRHTHARGSRSDSQSGYWKRRQRRVGRA